MVFAGAARRGGSRRRIVAKSCRHVNQPATSARAGDGEGTRAGDGEGTLARCMNRLMLTLYARLLGACRRGSHNECQSKFNTGLQAGKRSRDAFHNSWARQAAYSSASRTSPASRYGYAARMSGTDWPAATRPTTVPTVTRIPRMQGGRWEDLSSRELQSRRQQLLQNLQHCLASQLALVEHVFDVPRDHRLIALEQRRPFGRVRATQCRRRNEPRAKCDHPRLDKSSSRGRNQCPSVFTLKIARAPDC